MNLCVPCANRCRYCLLSYDGKTYGVDYKRSEAYANRFYGWIKANRPDLRFFFGFGYSMDHPDLLNAIDFLRSIGSPTGEFLQFDGMRFRSPEQIKDLLVSLKTHGIKLIDLTFYGTQEYHDRFASRAGDFRYMLAILGEANRTGLTVNVSIPVTHENVKQMDALLDELAQYQTSRIVCFVPHSEGRGITLDKIRFSTADYNALSQRVKSCFNRERFRPEKEWLCSKDLPEPDKRALTVTLTPENVDAFENMPFEETIAYLERLDDDYYRTIPDFRELAGRYGDMSGEQFYSYRDLYMKYQRRYIKEHQLEIYDINDERQCFSRRY